MPDHVDAQSTLVKKDLVDRLSAELDITKAKAQTAVQCVLDQIAAHVGDGGRVELREHFVLEVREHAPRAVRNPRTGERVVLPERRVVRFRPGRRMRDGLAALSQTVHPAQRNGQVAQSNQPALRIVGSDRSVGAEGAPAASKRGQRVGAS